MRRSVPATWRENVVVSEAEHVRLTAQPVLGTKSSITLTPATIFSELEPNHLIGLDFDGVVLLVLKVDADGADAVVLNGGKIGSNKAVVISPAPTLPALSEKDKEAVKIGRRLGVSHFALSFANRAEDVAELRELTGADSTIISKIESKRGVLNLDEILEPSDEILIDRGDLSREVPLENIPLLQKAIIRKANQAKVPVNVATNLLESMLINRKPTRAELNDIINTLLDGADGLVLAAETAIGKHPVARSTSSSAWSNAFDAQSRAIELKTSSMPALRSHRRSMVGAPQCSVEPQPSRRDKLRAASCNRNRHRNGARRRANRQGCLLASARLHDAGRAGIGPRQLSSPQRRRLDHANSAAGQRSGVRRVPTRPVDSPRRPSHRSGNRDPASRRQV